METFLFNADTLQNAVQKVRDKLGKDATIISWRNLGDGIEVTAAITRKAEKSIPQMGKAPRYDIFAAEEEEQAKAQKAIKPIIANGPQKGLKALVKGEVQTKIPSAPKAIAKAPIEKPVKEKPKLHALVGLLAKSGLSLAEIKPFAKYFDEDDIHKCFIKILESEYAFDPLPPIPENPIILVGPSGSGKTITTAKLAARALAKGQKVIAISTDTERQGGVEQLRLLVHKLGADFKACDSVQECKEITDKAVSKGNIVIIDSAAATQFDPSSMRMLARLIDETGAEPILCAQTDYRSDDFCDLLGEFKELGVKRAILTRMDLTNRRAGPLVGLKKHEISLAQIAPSPFIAGGIVPATAKRLAGLILEVWE